jgi:hypothetical protein
MSILLQSFATKQVQESPRDSESTGALMIGGEGVRLTKILSRLITCYKLALNPEYTRFYLI